MLICLNIYLTLLEVVPDWFYSLLAELVISTSIQFQSINILQLIISLLRGCDGKVAAAVALLVHDLPRDSPGRGHGGLLLARRQGGGGLAQHHLGQPVRGAACVCHRDKGDVTVITKTRNDVRNEERYSEKHQKHKHAFI